MGGGHHRVTPTIARKDASKQVEQGNVATEPKESSTTDTPAEENPIVKHIAMQMAKKGDEEAADTVLAAVQGWVKHHLFKRQKFIAQESDLDYSTNPKSICGQLLTKLNVEGDIGVNVWNHYRSCVRRELNKRRNCCQDQCKKVYLSK